MTIEYTGPFGPQSHSRALQRTTTNITNQAGDAHISEKPSITHPDSQDEPLLVHFNGHFKGEFNGTFLLPNTTYKKVQGESDALIAARRAMAKRNSRLFATRISRTKSRKKEVFGRPTKPEITLNTSFARHRGDAPRQLYPHETESKSSGGTIRKHTWLGLGRQSTKNKGLGITRGTPQPENLLEAPRAPPIILPYGTNTLGEQSDGTENLDPNTATPGSKTWQEVSPWDRAIPIGISIPSDSVTDFSPYESTRHRSASDTTLVTPSIIITPANAMKSVWSPDSASDYTASVYSRATFNFRQDNADIPPVPALPVDTKTTSTGGFNAETHRGLTEGYRSRPRNDTLDSAGTAFEDDENDVKQKERITSTATFFEEDETPLRNKNMLSTLSIDTDMVPTPRRSQGWWNVITTPFAMSRTNSIWTQGGRNMEKTPTIPVMPQRFGPNSASPFTPTTYIWSATEKSPSIRGNSPLVPTSIAVDENRQSEHVVYGFKAQTPPTARSHDGANTNDIPFVHGISAGVRNETHYESRQTPCTPDQNIVSPFSAMSPSPIVNTATTGTVMMPRQVQGAQPIHFVIELQDRRTDANGRATFTNTHAQPPIHGNIEYQGIQADASAQATNTNTPPRGTFEGNTGIQQIQTNSTTQERSVDTPSIGQPLRLNSEFQVTGSGVEIQAAKAHTLPMRHPIYTNSGLPNNPRDVGTQARSANTPPIGQPAHVSALTPRLVNVDLSTPGSSNNTRQELPVFAPPPTFAQNSSHFSYSYGSRVNSPAFTPDLKGQKHKRHRKISTMMNCVPFLRRFQKNKTDHEKKDQDKKKKKSRKGGWCFWCCGCCIIILVLLAIIVPVTVVLTKKHNNDSKAQDPPSQWLNLTDYPAIPTGFSTIAQPEANVEQSGCVAPATIWSCALPKEQQQSISPNKPDQPNFRLKITFENGTVVDPTKTLGTKRTVNPVSAGAFIRSRLLAARAPPSASPAPPSIQDQTFLGKNTDGNLAPFEGEDTPFFITFEEPQLTGSSRLAKRADANDASNITSVIPPPDVNASNITSVIPPPDVNADGTAKPANLYPLPSAQPLRLYNREKADEHYGFYVYYDRSIFLKSIKSDTGRGGNPADVDGGSPVDAATQRCTFSQTRFLVQIWTKSQGTKDLLQGSASNSSTIFKRPGSFPYPVTVTLDRHGGDPTKKNVYCYSIETDGTIKNIDSSRFFIFEDRKFGGNLVNGTQGLNVTTGPIDGGTGGCSCQWQNWITA